MKRTAMLAAPPPWIHDLARRSWLVGLAAGTACCVLAAHAVAALAEGAYLGPAAYGPSLPPGHAAAPPPPPRDGSALVERDMFCSDCAPQAGAPATGVAGDFHPDAELIAIAIGAPPLATLRVAGGAVQGSWAEGDRVPGVGIIERIGWQAIDVRADDGRTGTLHLAGADADAATSRPPPPAASSPWASRVHAVGANDYEVDRGLVRDLMHGGAMPRGFMISPVTSHGELGLRVTGVRPDSLAAALGLHSGDVVAAINSAPIRSAQQLLDLYAKIDSMSRVELGVQRGGAKVAIDLELR